MRAIFGNISSDLPCFKSDLAHEVLINVGISLMKLHYLLNVGGRYYPRRFFSGVGVGVARVLAVPFYGGMFILEAPF